MKVPVELDEQEWSQVIAIIANAHPLIAKISTQIVEHKRGDNAAQGNGLGPDTRIDTSRIAEAISQADRRHRAQQREAGSGEET
jgi:hypothetical protein